MKGLLSKLAVLPTLVATASNRRASIKVLAFVCGRSCQLPKILPYQIDLHRKPFESLFSSDQVCLFRRYLQLVRGVLRLRGLKCSDRALECVSRPLDHNRVT